MSTRMVPLPPESDDHGASERLTDLGRFGVRLRWGAAGVMRFVGPGGR